MTKYNEELGLSDYDFINSLNLYWTGVKIAYNYDPKTETPPNEGYSPETYRQYREIIQEYPNLLFKVLREFNPDVKLYRYGDLVITKYGDVLIDQKGRILGGINENVFKSCWFLKPDEPKYDEDILIERFKNSLSSRIENYIIPNLDNIKEQANEEKITEPRNSFNAMYNIPDYEFVKALNLYWGGMYIAYHVEPRESTVPHTGYPSETFDVNRRIFKEHPGTIHDTLERFDPNVELYSYGEMLLTKYGDTYIDQRGVIIEGINKALLKKCSIKENNEKKEFYYDVILKDYAEHCDIRINSELNKYNIDKENIPTQRKI